MQKFDYEVYTGNDLGAVYSPKMTRFKVWAPEAESVKLNLYKQGEGDNLIDQHIMKKSANGTYVFEKQGDCNGIYYTYTVVNHGEEQEAVDPYTKAAGVNGQRGMVINLAKTNPQGFEMDGYRNPEHITDAIIYEGSVRDFTMDESSGVFHNGKFLGLTEANTTNHFGEATALDYISGLGVTHVQILPAFDFETVDEKNQKAQYNWGYDPANYNVPDGSYSTDPYQPATRVKEFKQMVQALHRAGIRVIMDMVYNHTFNTVESNFERTVPGYFYRQKEDGTLANGSGCGNETASERPMMRKFMIESVLYWIKEYHIDGFRFDLMGVHDIETMNEIRKAVNKVDPTICIYGEGWAADTPQYPADSLAMKGNVSHMPGIAVFSDELRDGLCGPVWKKEKGAFLAGVPGAEMSVKFGIVAAIEHPQVRCDSVNYSQKPWAEQPTQMISYVSCHDGLCLVDRLKASMPGATPEQLVRLDKLAQTVVFTSQGIPFIYAGEEVMRDKQGVDNSYKSPDAVNAIDWRRKTTNGDVFMYYKRLIDLRKSHPAFRMGDAERVRKHLEFLPVEGQNLIAFRLKDHANGDSWEDIIVAFNSRMTPARLEVPVGKYTVVCKDGVIDVRGLGTQTGSEVIIPGQSALIMYK